MMAMPEKEPRGGVAAIAEVIVGGAAESPAPSSLHVVRPHRRVTAVLFFRGGFVLRVGS